MRIDAIGVTSRDMEQTLAFYRLLGFNFPEIIEEPHIEAITKEGMPRLMIDSHDLAKSLIGEPPRPSNHAVFALLYDSVAEVDQVSNIVAESGFQVVTPPWDAFWGQRYAVVADPDGYRVDLFASLEA